MVGFTKEIYYDSRPYEGQIIVLNLEGTARGWNLDLDPLQFDGRNMCVARIFQVT